MRHITLLFSLFFLFPFIIVAQTITTKESRCVNTGEITISGTVGAGGPYQFSFTNYPPAYTPSGIQTTNTLPYTFAALFPGLYSIAVRDRLGAIFNFQNIQVNGNYVLPGNNDYAPVVTNITSCSVANGTIQGAMSNGRPPYTYKIISGPVQVGIVNNTGFFTGLVAGNYRVQAADSCQNFQTRDVIITDNATTFGIASTVIRRTGCTIFSLDSVNVLPQFPANGRYEVVNFNNSGIAVIRASGSNLPLIFNVYSPSDIINGRVTIAVYDTCGNRTAFVPLTYKNFVRDTIANGTINRIGCNLYSLDALSMTPPLAPGAIVQLTNRSTGVVYSSPLPLQFSASPGDITSGQITVAVTDSCGSTVTNTANLRTINNLWNFNPVIKIYCSTVVIDSLIFRGFVVTPYTIKVKALFTDSTGNIDSTSDQFVTSFPFTVAGIGGSPNPLTIRIEVTDSCGEIRRVTLSQSFLLASGVMRPMTCGITSIDLSVLGRFVLPVSYSVSPDPGVGSNTTGHFELPEGIYRFTARDSCGKQASLGPLDFSRRWMAKAAQFKGCSGQYIINEIYVPKRSSGSLVVKQYEGAPPVTSSSIAVRTKFFNSVLNNCVACGDTVTTGEVISFDSTLPAHTYTYIISDSCNKTDTVTLINDTAPLQFYHQVFAKIKCVSGSNIYANWKSTGDPFRYVFIKVYNEANTELVNFNSGSISNVNTHPNGQLILSDAPRGRYFIKYKLAGCTQEYIDTVVTLDYIQPIVGSAQSFLPCAGGSPLVVAGSEGIAPYQFEIVNSFPDHFSLPPQLSPLFTLPSSQSSVTIRITDACLNSSTRTVAITSVQPPFIRSSPSLLATCTLPFNFNLVVDSVYAGSVFEWTKISGLGASQAAIGSGTILPVQYSTILDTGTYKVRVTVPGSCLDEVSTFTVGIIPVTCSAGIAGNVFNDANGLADGIVNGRGTNAGGVYALLVNASGIVTDVSEVSAQGAYNFAGVLQGQYSIIITGSVAAINLPPPASALPEGWVYTGENAGVSPGDDGTINGKLLNISIDSTVLINLNFGIERLPLANDTTVGRTNPGGNLRVTVPVLTGSDAEDGVYDGVSGINTVIIQTLPANAVLYYNGLPVIAGQIIQQYNPSLLTIDPADNIASASFTFSEIDAALQISVPATVIIVFYGLPVHLTSFTATVLNGKVQLNWQVSEQLNILTYDVETSTDGNNFSVLGSVAAVSASRYAFTHGMPVNGINFYRLKIIESDGSFKYSKIVTAEINKASRVQVLPNPFTNSVQIIVSLPNASPVSTVIFDATGRKIYERTVYGNTGINKFEITSLQHFASGIYMVSVTSNKLISNHRLIKE
jgi:hypothetical protein